MADPWGINGAKLAQCLLVPSMGKMVKEKAHPVLPGQQRASGIGLLQQRNTALPVHARGQAKAHLGQQFGIVGVQCARGFQGLQAFIPLPQEPFGKGAGVIGMAGAGGASRSRRIGSKRAASSVRQ